jgi:exodeoxyribonuclease VII small subunit
MAKRTDFDYARKTAELEVLLAKLQDSTTPLDEAIKLHAAGQKLVGELEDFLKHAENEVHEHLTKAE